MTKKMMLLQLESVIHHALLQLLYIRDNEAAGTLVSDLKIMGVEDNGIDIDTIRNNVVAEIVSGQYEHVLSALQDFAAGSYFVMPVVESLLETIKKEGEQC